MTEHEMKDKDNILLPPDKGEDVFDVCRFEDCTSPRAIGRCLSCGLAYCLDHASDVEPQKYCITCISRQTIETKSTPLIDPDGVRHQGRHILATGDAFRFVPKMIHEMSEAELLVHIDQERAAIDILAKQLDFHRISLSASEFEAYERKLGTLKRVDGELRISIGNTTRERVSKGMSRTEAKTRLRTKRAAQQVSVDALLDSLNLDPAKLLELLQKAGKK